MSQHRPSVSPSEEVRISRLEKRDADYGSDDKNVAQTSGPVHIERPHDLLKVIENAVELVGNDSRSTGVAKGRALAHIAGIAARILLLVELADAQVAERDTVRKGQSLAEVIANSPRAREAVKLSWKSRIKEAPPLASLSET